MWEFWCTMNSANTKQQFHLWIWCHWLLCNNFLHVLLRKTVPQTLQSSQSVWSCTYSNPSTCVDLHLNILLHVFLTQSFFLCRHSWILLMRRTISSDKVQNSCLSIYRYLRDQMTGSIEASDEDTDVCMQEWLNMQLGPSLVQHAKEVFRLIMCEDNFYEHQVLWPDSIY